jgi:hypothetical protein
MRLPSALPETDHRAAVLVRVIEYRVDGGEVIGSLSGNGGALTPAMGADRMPAAL